MNTRLRRSVAVVLAMATTLGASATAHAAPGMEVGLQDDKNDLHSGAYRPSAFYYGYFAHSVAQHFAGRWTATRSGTSRTGAAGLHR